MHTRALLQGPLRPVLLAIVAGAVTSPARADSPETVVCAAFDVGPSTTKLKVARIDAGTGELRERLFPLDDAERAQAEIKVPYNEAFRDRSDGTLPVSIMIQGLRALRTLVGEARRRGATRFAGVASAVFLQATGGMAVVERLGRVSGVPLRVISGEEEAALGFEAVTRGAGGADPVVWDIGGGSQLLTMRGSAGLEVGILDVASDAFKYRVLHEVKHTPGAESPNPLSAAEIEGAWKIARGLTEFVPAPLRDRIRRPGARIIGIGGVHGWSVRDQVGHSPYTLADVRSALGSLAGKTDGKIGGPFASTLVTNLVLVGGLMEGLGIQEVSVQDINLADGLLLSPDRWRAKGTAGRAVPR